MTTSARSADKDLVVSLIGKTLGFRDCEPATLRAMVQAGHFRTYGKGEAVVRRTEPFDHLCFLVHGSVEASLNLREGHRHLISFLLPGDVAGIISVIDGMGHVNDMFARERGTTVLLVPGDVVRSLRAQDRRLARAFELQLAFRSRLLYERLDTHPGVELEVRLARVVVLLARLHGVTSANGVSLMHKISQSDLADLLGATRQRVNYALKVLRESGLIQVTNSTFTAPDITRLEAYSLQQS